MRASACRLGASSRNRGEQLRKDLGVASERYFEIVDYFHVAERLSDLSKRTQAKWGEEIRLGWLHEQKRRLKARDIEEIERVVQIIGTRKLWVLTAGR